MPYATLSVPPGVFRAGTEYQTKGRVYDANLVRWYGAAFGPIKGWTARGSNAVSGLARAIINWRDNSGNRRSGVGTHTKLYAINSAYQNFDITPTDFVAGNSSASPNIGYGGGVYGAGTYGTPRPDTGSYTPATVWDLDTFGEYLVGCAQSDGRILQWALDTGVKAAAVTNAPTSCLGLFVTAEGALVALGSGGDPRNAAWSDLRNNTVWTPSATNKAGDFTLQTNGSILCGRRMPGQSLIQTDSDAWTMTYVGDVFVYGFRKVGSGCGALSRGGTVVVGNQAVWWGAQGFWAYDGAVRSLACDVLDYVQNNLNTAQQSKITSFHNNEFGEVWWHYPSAGSAEIDSYVVWCYRDNTWNIGSKERLCEAEQRDVFIHPIGIDASGQIYEDEVGSAYGGVTPYARLGPQEIGLGDNVAHVVSLIADEATLGDASVVFRTRFFPNGPETVSSSYTLGSTGQTDVRFTARQLEMTVSFGADNGARWGSPRIEVVPGGLR